MTGVAVATVSLDVHWHDTYFVVAHFHFIMVGAVIMAFLAAIHYWFPKMFGRMYHEGWGMVAAASSSWASTPRSSLSSCSATPACRGATTCTRSGSPALNVASTAWAPRCSRSASSSSSIYLIWALMHGEIAGPNPVELARATSGGPARRPSRRTSSRPWITPKSRTCIRSRERRPEHVVI